MELPTKIIVILTLLILVLAVVASFFLTNTGTQIDKTKAQKLFQDTCMEYSQKNCGWEVTEDPGFEPFVRACKILYGEEKEAFSCLYSYCTQCSNVAAQNVRCAGICSGIEGQKKLGGNIEETCRIYKADEQCAKVSCSMC